MRAVSVTVLTGGWWLPGKALVTGQVLELDAATADALARRGIVRIEPPAPAPDVAANASTPAPNPRQPRRKPSLKEV